jgi:hypothetical protein
MEKTDHVILGVHVTGRVQHVPPVQKLLTEYGCNIKTRLGLHEVSDNFCSPNGLIILELVGDPVKCRELTDKLSATDGIDVQKMVFGH